MKIVYIIVEAFLTKVKGSSYLAPGEGWVGINLTFTLAGTITQTLAVMVDLAVRFVSAPVGLGLPPLNLHAGLARYIVC